MNKSFYWSLTLLSFSALALVIVNMALFSGNRELQQQAATRQQEIAGGVRINQLNNQMIQLIAQTSVANQDERLRSLLLDNGVTFENNAQQPAVPAETTAKPAQEGAQ